jgi:flagellar biosynthesis/type III secretory pathway M-ring protein FliF/YscJ
MAQIINILSDEDKRIKSITFLVFFGLVKIIVWLYVDEQLKRRKSRRDEENEKEETKMNDPPTPQGPNPPCVVVISENQSSTAQ